jgi:hypothetical protein
VCATSTKCKLEFQSKNKNNYLIHLWYIKTFALPYGCLLYPKPNSKTSQNIKNPRILLSTPEHHQKSNQKNQIIIYVDIHFEIGALWKKWGQRHHISLSFIILMIDSYGCLLYPKPNSKTSQNIKNPRILLSIPEHMFPFNYRIRQWQNLHVSCYSKTNVIKENQCSVCKARHRHECKSEWVWNWVLGIRGTHMVKQMSLYIIDVLNNCFYFWIEIPIYI